MKSPYPQAIGVIGVGRMGLAVCARLVERGFSVFATDVRASARVAVDQLGAGWVDEHDELAKRCQRILTVLPGVREVQSLGPDLLAAMRPGSTWIDLSTLTPDVANAVAENAQRREIHFLDAPMGGGPTEARAGELTLFIGGSDAQVRAHGDLTQALATRVLHIGSVGSGYLMKLLANLLWFSHAIAGAEALALAERSGLAPERVRAALTQSAGTSRFMEHEARALLAGENLRSFSLAGCVEELHAVTTLADKLGISLPLTECVTNLYDESLTHYGDIDGELLAARLVAERAGVTFSHKISDVSRDRTPSA